MSTGGSIQQVTVNKRLFAVAADADPDRDLGGFTVEILANGDGSARQKKTRKPWSLKGLTLQIDNEQGDLEYLQDVMDGRYGKWVPITVTYADGFTYSGRGTVVGDLSGKAMAATADVEMSGPFKLKVQ